MIDLLLKFILSLNSHIDAQLTSSRRNLVNGVGGGLLSDIFFFSRVIIRKCVQKHLAELLFTFPHKHEE